MGLAPFMINAAGMKTIGTATKINEKISIRKQKGDISQAADKYSNLKCSNIEDSPFIRLDNLILCGEMKEVNGGIDWKRCHISQKKQLTNMPRYVILYETLCTAKIQYKLSRP